MRHLLSLLIFVLSMTAQASTALISIEGVPASRVDYYKQKVANALAQGTHMENIQLALEALYKTDTISGASVYQDETSDGKTNYVFRLKLKQLIKNILIKGNINFSKSEILAELGLNEGESLSEERIKQGIENVKKFYNLNGFLSADVSADFAAPEAIDLTLVLNVKESLPTVINNISFLSSNDRLNTNLVNLTRKKIGRPFSQLTLNEIQQEVTQYLSAEKYFSTSVSVEEPKYSEDRTRVSLSLTLTDPYFYSLIFTGNEQYSDPQILKDLDLDQNNKLTSSPVDDLKERILRFYKKRGYANATIQSQEKIVAQEYMRRINFIITEGPRVKIKRITLEGNFTRPENYYADFIFEHSGDLIQKRFYNSEDLDTGIKNLIIELQNQGFISAQVPSTRVDFDKKRESVIIKVVLNEGPQTFIDNLIFRGTSRVSTKELEQVTGLKAGGPLRLSDLADASNRITLYYKELGYLDAKIQNQSKDIISYFDENKKAHLTFDIYEGPQITVNGILVEGNNFTKDYVIRRELQFADGEVLTPEKINYSEARLRNLGLFDTVEIRTLLDDPSEGKRAVLIIVTERDPGVFRAGIGANNEITLTLKAFAGVGYTNLKGTGRSIRVRAEGNLKLKSDKLPETFPEREITLGYTEPYIFDTNNNMRFAATYSTKLYNVVSPLVYGIEALQSDIVFERDLSRQLKLLLQLYGISHSNIYEVQNRAPIVQQDIATLGPTLVYDLRDNPYNPTRGSLSSISLEYSAPFMGSSPTVNYAKSVGTFSKYFPLGPMVLAQQFSAGVIRNLNTSGNIPQLKAFILGGRSTIRGFDSYETLPRLTEIPNGISGSYNFYGLSKTELRFTISTANNIGGTIFYDGGHLEYQGFTTNYPWRDSVGVGLRYITPLGPVSLEFGYKLNRDESRGEGPYALHFSIGVF